ncbi:MAG: class I SAM-dependent methyltransferase [Candidatus Schekmanbacteria bacterium]|nr:class I SAM-dependent methyltransferase [Candidatus Schekmanbacteria bacterium]
MVGQILKHTVDFLVLLKQISTGANLTAVTAPRDYADRHWAESMLLYKVTQHCCWSADLLDLGSGAGVPGIPLAIFLAPARTTLVERSRKRAAFLRLAVRSAHLPTSVVVLNLDLTFSTIALAPNLLGACTIMLARAVASPTRLVPLAERLLAPGGALVLSYPTHAPTTLPALLRSCQPPAPFLAPAIHRTALPLSGAPRTIVELRKIAADIPPPP